MKKYSLALIIFIYSYALFAQDHGGNGIAGIFLLGRFFKFESIKKKVTDKKALVKCDFFINNNASKKYPFYKGYLHLYENGMIKVYLSRFVRVAVKDQDSRILYHELHHGDIFEFDFNAKVKQAGAKKPAIIEGVLDHHEQPYIILNADLAHETKESDSEESWISFPATMNMNIQYFEVPVQPTQLFCKDLSYY